MQTVISARIELELLVVVERVDPRSPHLPKPNTELRTRASGSWHCKLKILLEGACRFAAKGVQASSSELLSMYDCGTSRSPWDEPAVRTYLCRSCIDVHGAIIGTVGVRELIILLLQACGCFNLLLSRRLRD